jgi:sugar lactone lactonase YvrE
VRATCFEVLLWMGALLTLLPVAVLPVVAAPPPVPAYGYTYANGYLQWVDLRTGAASRIGPNQAEVIQALAFDPAGKLFGVGYAGIGSAKWALFRFDVASGETTGGVALDSAFGELVTGLAFDGCGKLWTVTAPSASPYGGSLVVLDPVTGTPTVIGPLGLDVTSVAALGNRLYGLVGGSRGGWGLAAIDRATGKATSLGPLTPSFGQPLQSSSLAFDGLGRLWAMAQAPFSTPPPNATSPIALFDPSTGGATPVAGSTLLQPNGLAISPPLGACAAAATCVPSSTTLCLGNLRFAVQVSWQTRSGATGAGQAVPLTGDSGSFWFFDDANLELVVKVVDGCAAGGHHWVFAGGLTDVGVALDVTDLESGKTRTYRNPLGEAFQPIQDTAAFAACP